MIELQHEAHDAEHVGVAADRSRVDGQAALHATLEKVAEIGETRGQARSGERRYAVVSLSFGHHATFFRRGTVGVNELHIRAEQLVFI